jgi:hypothetical protein
MIKGGSYPNYPGRIYGMYEWSVEKNRWNISKEWLITCRIQKMNSILKKI